MAFEDRSHLAIVLSVNRLLQGQEITKVESSRQYFYVEINCPKLRLGGYQLRSILMNKQKEES